MSEDTSFDSGSWQEVQALFHAALDIPELARQKWLNEQAVLQRTRLEVQSLLAALQQHEQLCEADIAVASGTLTGQDLIGRLCGPYRLGRLIASGGMGLVYEAERHSPEFNLRAAVKITPALFGIPAIERFRQEKQILAGLSHSGIAHLLDGGVTAQGLSYLAMEFVDGESISAYVKKRSLTEREIIPLVLQVCDAIAYAHHKRVVHRDIKPGNVLVTEGGVVKLLDFGIAKLLDPDERSAVTAWRAHTPRYASPEQLRGESAGPGSDIYQIGALLAELLAREPSKQERSDKVLAEASRNLSPDLAEIVTKSTNKEPQDRYASASELTDDLKRYLAGQPIAAQGALHSSFPLLVSLRARKNAHRVIALFAAIALITGGILFVHHERERGRGEREEVLERIYENAKTFVALDAQDPADMAIARTRFRVQKAALEAALRADPKDTRLLMLLGDTLDRSAAVAWLRYGPSLTNVEAAYSDLVQAVKCYRTLAHPDSDLKKQAAHVIADLEDVLIEKGRGTEAFEAAIQLLANNVSQLAQTEPADFAGEHYDLLSDKLGAANPWTVDDLPESWQNLAAFRPYLLTDRLAANAYERFLSSRHQGVVSSLIALQLGRLDVENGNRAKGLALLIEARRSFEESRGSTSTASVQRWTNTADFALCRALEADGRYYEAAQACKPAVANGELRAARQPQVRYLQERLAVHEVQYGALLYKLGIRAEAERRTRFGLQTIRADLRLPGAPTYVLDWAAQTLLTVRPSRLRDRQLALTFAEKAVQVSAAQVPSYLVTLAIAQDACGKNALAQDTARRAVAAQAQVLQMMKPFEAENAESKRIYGNLHEQLDRLQTQFASR